jgi:hypothetical protein
MAGRRLLAGLAAVLALSGVALADPVSEAPDSVAVTAYRDPLWSNTPDDWERYWQDWNPGVDENDGLVLITETRTIDVPAGRAKISFRGVADGIIPQTVAIDGLPAVVRERNQDYDLLTPAALIDKSIGKRVRLVRTNSINGVVTEESATVRSGPHGTVLDYGDGRVEALGCSGWPERLVFDELPEGLADKPTLSVETDAPAAGRYKVRLTYLAFGLKWGANYVAQVHPDGRALDLLAWITLANRSDTSFVNAPTAVLAGDVERDGATQPPQPRQLERTDECWPMDTTTGGARPPAPPPDIQPRLSAPGMVQALIVTAQKREESIQDVPLAVSALLSDLGDYKVYTLPEPTTVAAHQTKQVMMFMQPDVPFERLYVERIEAIADENQDEAEVFSPATVLRMQNKRGSKLARPLPAGMVRVMEPLGDGSLLTGEDAIDDSPVGLPVDIKLSQSRGVTITSTDKTRWTDHRWSGELVMANDRPEAATLELRLWQGHAKLVSAPRGRQSRFGYLVWTFKLKPGERKTVRYVIDWG